MNARFRIGNVYRFKAKTNEIFISEKPIKYIGYDDGKFMFNWVDRLCTLDTYDQGCLKSWIERGLVEVETEWDKARGA